MKYSIYREYGNIILAQNDIIIYSLSIPDLKGSIKGNSSMWIDITKEEFEKELLRLL